MLVLAETLDVVLKSIKADLRDGLRRENQMWSPATTTEEEEKIRSYIEGEFLPKHCGGDENLLHRVLMVSARKRVGTAVTTLCDFLESDDVRFPVQALCDSSSQEEVSVALERIGNLRRGRVGEEGDPIVELGPFVTMRSTFVAYPYSLLPRSDEVSAITSHTQDFYHDFEKAGIGGFLMYSYSSRSNFFATYHNLWKFYRRHLENLRMASLCILRILQNAVRGERKEGEIDLREVMSVVESALLKRLVIDRRNAPGHIDIHCDIPDQTSRIDDACFEELFLFLYELGKNAGLLLDKKLRGANDREHVRYEMRSITFEGNEYIAIRVSDSAGGFDLRSLFRGKRRVLQGSAEEGDAEAQRALLEFDKWRYREMTVGEVLNLIFERRVSGQEANAAQGGSTIHTSGLGLDMAKRILENHNGRVFVTDSSVVQENGGAVFLILIPCHPNTQQRVDPLGPIQAEVPRAIEEAMMAA